MFRTNTLAREGQILFRIRSVTSVLPTSCLIGYGWWDMPLVLDEADHLALLITEKRLRDWIETLTAPRTFWGGSIFYTRRKVSVGRGIL